MKKRLVLDIVRILIKYVFPIILGYIEGDTHVLANTFLGI